MKFKRICILALFVATAASLTVWASDTPGPDNPDDDFEVDDEAELRENPVIEEGEDDPGITVPDFVKEGKNHITMNGADWSAASKALHNVKRNPFTIVHIGDSHLQADIATGTARELFQYDYGNAGRGLVTPLRITGTNEPSDYQFQSSDKWIPAKVMKTPWPHTMGFTGSSIRPSRRSSEIFVATREDDDYNPFSSITLFHNGRMNVTAVEDRNGKAIPFSPKYSRDYTHIDLTSEQTGVRVRFDTEGDLTLFGASLSGNRPGVFYHTIGNNGAAYQTYNNIGTVGAGIAPLQPDLVIISLGTNEAFGHFNAATFTSQMDRLVKNIKAANPQASILLVTPMECQRSIYNKVTRKVKKAVKVPVKGKKGKRKKYKTQMKTVNETQRVRSYGVNTNVAAVRNAILQYGHNNNIAVYDWYDVAGGSGASAKWLDGGLYGRDRVHHTAKGYRLQGYMLYKAVNEALNK
ncbi:MAG: GDSL-type esterase/lipase family protein [Muribaculaceae bacterium]|nr:GDSL-type esterase/lipase family protein [Muribaculaceae bacterium]